MKTYTVRYQEVFSACFDIEADSPEEAMELFGKAIERFCYSIDSKVECVDSDVSVVCGPFESDSVDFAKEDLA